MKKNGLYSLLILMLFSCQPKDKPKTLNEVIGLQQESFPSFYERFHKDSLFQISRIKFPLRGNSDGTTVKVYWTKGEWLMQHLVDTTLYSKKFSVSNNIVIEKITDDDPRWVTKRKFQNIKGKWFLIYYEDIN